VVIDRLVEVEAEHVWILDRARLRHDGQVAPQLAWHGPEPAAHLVDREGPPFELDLGVDRVAPLRPFSIEPALGRTARAGCELLRHLEGRRLPGHEVADEVAGRPAV